jgi:hypothetical protein
MATAMPIIPVMIKRNRIWSAATAVMATLSTGDSFTLMSSVSGGCGPLAVNLFTEGTIGGMTQPRSFDLDSPRRHSVRISTRWLSQ